jgi:hypothetical protein
LWIALPKAYYNTKKDGWINQSIMVFAIGAVFVNILELTCYVIVFFHLNDHNNTVAATVLERSVIHRRNRTNAISMLGQVATWLMELSYFCLIFVVFSNGNFAESRELASIVKTSEFCLIPLVQILTSPPLKRFVFQNFSK